jgi:hypothetical protein
MSQDLGEIAGPVVLFGGPYSNLQATEGLLARSRAWPGARLICTGDMIAYCAQPVETVAALRDSGAAIVAGNCELQLAADAKTCGCGFEAGSACDLLSAGWYSFARAQIGAGTRAWMASLPGFLSFTHAGKRYGVLHGGATDVARFLWEMSPASAFEEEWDALEQRLGPVEGVIAGHCGIPFERPLSRGRWINAGVIGMPPNDGRQSTWFAVLDAGRLSFNRLSYDAGAAHAQMLRAGLTQGYHDSLLSGHWPSEDVLPAGMRRGASASG